MSLQAIAAGLAVGLTLAAFVPYIRAIVCGRARPHVFSWLIWGLSTVVVFFAQLAAGGGVGAWPIGISGLISLGIAVLAWRRRGDTDITAADWVFLIGALAALPLWYLSADPLWAVVVLTVVDGLGFGPTLRKAYHHPASEPLGFYALIALRNALVLPALERHSLTTMLFPGVMTVACLALILLVGVRRRQVAVADLRRG